LRPSLTFTALEGIPEIEPGASLESLLVEALARDDIKLADRDVLVLCQKIVSKAENRYVDLNTIEPSERARQLAAKCVKDARFVELVLRESTEVIRCVKDVLIVRHRLGFVVANAAIDQSNIPGAEHRALLLPSDPDASAARLRRVLHQRLGINVAVLVSDSFGRPWRLGVCGTCIGCAGLKPLLDMRGKLDRFGRALKVTQIAAADEIVAGATFVMGEADEGRPAVIVSGVPEAYFLEPESARALIRPSSQDLFT
jgi:coenzyme F420-0:L-glutamate ligase/coenzyme F420-1:gamma-L-glutamate ligase